MNLTWTFTWNKEKLQEAVELLCNGWGNEFFDMDEVEQRMYLDSYIVNTIFNLDIPWDEYLDELEQFKQILGESEFTSIEMEVLKRYKKILEDLIDDEW